MFGSNSDIKGMQKEIRTAFKAVREEMNVHLDTINQNSSEMQSIYEYMNELDSKIEKLNERIDAIQMVVNPEQDDSFSIELTHREQEVFVVIYTESGVISAKEISKRLGFTDEMVNRYVYNMISKGVPLLRQYVNGDI
jgi:DNA-binding NarL/FixJ family response regulator